MIKKHNITEYNIVEDKMKTMVNNGYINYKESPCILMNNLVSEHNEAVDIMGEAVLSNVKVENNITNISNVPMVNEVKSYDEPVDYETAFGEYYPEDKKTT